jgi:hypothetical protein
MTHATFSPEVQIATRLEKLGMTRDEFCQISGVPKASLSRWLSTRIPANQEENLMDLVRTLEELFRRLHPFRPDTSSETFIFNVRKYRLGQLLVSVVDLDKDNSKTREELLAMRNRFDVGVDALLNGEQDAATASV